MGLCQETAPGVHLCTDHTCRRKNSKCFHNCQRKHHKPLGYLHLLRGQRSLQQFHDLKFLRKRLPDRRLSNYGQIRCKIYTDCCLLLSNHGIPLRQRLDQHRSLSLLKCPVK